MFKTIPASAVAILITMGCATSVSAQSSAAPAAIQQQPASTSSKLPDSAFFAGVGGGYASSQFNNQSIYAEGISSTFDNRSLVASGSAGGPPLNLSMPSQSTFAPTVQLGYFQRITNSDWLWGAKFSYNYLGATSTKDNFLIPQSGSFSGSSSNSFTGNALVRSFQTSITNQIMLMPFIGHRFDNGFVYFGAGPTLSQTQSKINDLTGFADINGNRTNITGNSSSFSSAQWIYGGAATVGMTYFFDPSWFVDVSYTYAMTQNKTSNYSGVFANPNSGYSYAGQLIGTSTGSVTTQLLTISINKAF